ncbi:hypothetical protein ATN88_01005 [Enterovibrio coralii]|uniref:Uncharacterized protein n=2 Tax=Enterovibrio coralii TaxID=294935 RepID=A0A135I7C5_9GAMM|nr:hypothetical protein ATN88_01005 [Enterovibrio coralii]
MGQFYPDRLFVLFGFILCYLVYFRVNILATISVAIIVILLNERAALIGGGIMLLLPFTNTKKSCSAKEISPYLIIGGAMLFYSFLVKTYMLSNQYYDSFLPSSFTDLYSRFSLDAFRDNLLTLILVSLPLLLACLGNLKLAFLSFIIMSPNIIGNVGGAEKVGWLTHYHSYYFPILVFSGAVGYSEWMSKYKTKAKFLLIFPSVILSLYIYNSEITSKRLPSIEEQQKSFISFEHLVMGLPTGYDIRSDVESKVQLGKNVVTDELGMALLKDKAEVSLFPLSIKDSDYLFIPCEWTRHDTFNNSALPLEWFKQNDFETKFFERINALDRCFYRKK